MSKLLDDFLTEVKKYSAVELSKKSGVNPNTIYSWRHGTSIPNLESAELVADAMDMEFLLFDKEKP